MDKIISRISRSLLINDFKGCDIKQTNKNLQSTTRAAIFSWKTDFHIYCLAVLLIEWLLLHFPDIWQLICSWWLPPQWAVGWMKACPLVFWGHLGSGWAFSRSCWVLTGLWSVILAASLWAKMPQSLNDFGAMLTHLQWLTGATQLEENTTLGVWLLLAREQDKCQRVNLLGTERTY